MRIRFALLLLLWSPAAAGATEIPSVAALGADPAALARIVGDRTVILLRDPQPLAWKDGKKTIKRDVRFVSGLSVIAAPVTAVREAVTDFKHYKDFMPQTDEVSIVSHEGNKTVVDFELEFELPVMNVGVDYTLAYVDEPDGDVTWTLVEGDMDQNVGRWEFFPLEGNRTLLAYTNWTDLKGMGFGVRVILDAQPDLQIAIPVASAAVMLDAVHRRAEGLPKTAPKPKNVTKAEPDVPLLSAGQPPIPLTAMRKLAGAGTVVFVHPAQWVKTADGPTELVFVSAAKLVRQPPARTRALATQFERYGEFFEQISKVKVARDDAKTLVDWRLKLGFGIFAVPVDYTLAYTPTGDDVLSFHRVKGDIQYIYGAWEWMAPGEGETLAFYTTASEMGEKAPAILKLGNLVPNRQITIGVSSAAIILEKLAPWIEKESRKE